MRPLVATVAQLLHQRALGAAEGSPKHLVPCLPHKFEERRHVPVGDRRLADGPVVAEVTARCVGGLRLVLALELALDEGREARAEQVHRLADTFLIGDRHRLLLGFPKQAALLDLGLADLPGEPGDLGPALDEAVIGERLGRAFLALA